MIVLASAAGVAWSVVALLAVASTQLRPVSDDYCHASVALEGYFPSLVTWYMTWIGDLFQVSVTALLVGQTLANLPLAVASAIPFLLTAAGVAAVVIVMTRTAVSGGRRATYILAVSLAAPITILLWWGFWWLPAAVDPNPAGSAALLASAITHWQVVNVQYTLVPILVIIGWMTVDRLPAGRWRLIAFGALGLITGTGGLVLGVAGVTFAVAVAVVRSLLDVPGRRARIAETLSFGVAAMAGLVVAYVSPGAQGRAEILREGQPLESVSIPGLFSWIFPQATVTWVAALVTPGVLAAVIVSAALALLLAAVGIRLDGPRLLRLGGAFLALSLILAVAARGGEAFSYVALWHEVTTRTVVFIAAMAVGLALGALSARTGLAVAVPTMLAAVVVMLTVVGSLLVMRADMIERRVLWDSGPAPTAAAADIELDWIDGCWTTLQEARDLPSR